MVPVRDGTLPAGADEAVADADGAVVVVGRGAEDAYRALVAACRWAAVAEAGPFSPGGWAAALAGMAAVQDAGLVLLPGSADGRDLAPRLADALDRPLYAGLVTPPGPTVGLARYGGAVVEEQRLDSPAVATLVPGLRGVEPLPAGYRAPDPVSLRLPPVRDVRDVEVLEVTPPDPATMDLAEAPFILAGGAGLGGAEAFAALEALAGALGASMGATRVVTDAGWVPFERQIGTTGVAVNPRVYVALGISGAVQHTSGLGHPEHVIAVNTDPSCPMMTMADLAVVSDAPGVLAALARLTEARHD